jgi:arsenate reductase-like glutaredoxin family protein
MPAPLGKIPTKKMPKIEVLGLEDSQGTRAAVRFFRERRVVVTFTDLRKRPIEQADLRQFADGIGAAAFTDPAAMTGGDLLARVRADSNLLHLPLVRHGHELTAGQDEAKWKAWLARRGR